LDLSDSLVGYLLTKDRLASLFQVVVVQKLQFLNNSLYNPSNITMYPEYTAFPVLFLPLPRFG
jgi:hypothetical protein